MDQHRSCVPENQPPYRSSGQSDKRPRKDTPKKDPPGGQVDIIAMVRSLQRTAGMTDCFRRGNADCDIIDCDWRTHCLSAPADPKKNGTNKPKRK
jgi:hypothetical protein